MRVVLVGIAVLAFAGITVLGYSGGPSLKDLNVSQPERDVLSGRIIFSTICVRCPIKSVRQPSCRDTCPALMWPGQRTINGMRWPAS